MLYYTYAGTENTTDYTHSLAQKEKTQTHRFLSGITSGRLNGCSVHYSPVGIDAFTRRLAVEVVSDHLLNLWNFKQNNKRPGS